ncbi:MAG: DUF2309 domain-containing protein [Pirellulaceae bacterium]
MNKSMTVAQELEDEDPPGPLQIRKASVRHSIEHATHLLPSQGPISVFVHHNTLHAFEELPFAEAVVAGGKLYHCEPYLSEDRFRHELSRGRIRIVDLESVLLDDLGDAASTLVATFGTRYALRLAMLQFPIRNAPDAELHWLIAETEAQDRFREEVEPAMRERTIAQTRHWVMRDLRTNGNGTNSHARQVLQDLLSEYGGRDIESWGASKWESFVLRFLWRVCNDGVREAMACARVASDSDRVAASEASVAAAMSSRRTRDLLLQATGKDSDRLVDEVLIRFCAAYLDQGFADWELPEREQGFFRAFAQLYSASRACVPGWLRRLRQEMRVLFERGTTPLESIAASLEFFDVSEQEQDDFILQALLALRGWAGLIWQMETSAPWTPWPAPHGTLEGYLAIRLILERHALAFLAGSVLSKGSIDTKSHGPLAQAKVIQQLRRELERQNLGDKPRSLAQVAFTIYQLAQLRGWSPQDLVHLSPQQWSQLIKEIHAFHSVERRRVFHLAYERKYRNEALDAIMKHAESCGAAERQVTAASVAAFQVVTCIDDREESFRRHLEEIDPECETYGAAGFFAVAMYYQGAAEAHYRPLCPIIITPQHYVREEPVFSATDVSEKRMQRRRIVGRMTHQVHSRSRTLLGGVVTGLLGSLATFPLVARILAPRLTAQLRSVFGAFVRPPATELHVERVTETPGPEPDALGYSVPEMASIVVRILQDIGLVGNLAPIVLFMGHGSSSMNNPHESAYNCGACSGGRGGPNARAFAFMANDRRVRELVAQAGIAIADDVRFVGAYHNTCNDYVEYYDLDQLPRSHRGLFVRMEQSINEARARNAHERVRRFESASLELTTGEALAHVEERAEDLSQARPEYNHATNALCFVGRRKWSRGLFLDRRAFLTSYDPSIDDDAASILGRILGAAIPVCAGISLEYLFSTIDSEGYGCGSKLPHNIAGLAGVMTGAASDIRPGLSAQMVEIHEPIRILFVIETTVEKMTHIMNSQAIIGRLVRNDWVQLAVYDAATNQIQRFVNGAFVPYQAEAGTLPVCRSSQEWYRGWRDHIGFCSIVSPQVDNGIATVPRSVTDSTKGPAKEMQR